MSPNRREAEAIAALALPVVLTQVGTMTLGLVDMYMVSFLGTSAVAAASLGNVWIWGTSILAIGILMGIDPIVSQAHGAGDGKTAGLALQRGLLLAALLSLPVMLAWAFGSEVLTLAGQRPALSAEAGTYLRAQAFSVPAFLAFSVLRQYLAGRGIMRPALVTIVLGNLVNVVLNWAFVFGHMGFEPRGLVGSAIATGCSRVFMLLALTLFTLALRLHEGGWAGWSREALDRAGLRKVLWFGLPIGAQMGLEVWAFHLTTLLAGRFGEADLAAHTIVLLFASTSFMMPLGISIAASARVGNLIGARAPAEADRAARVSLALGGGVMLASALLFVALRKELPALFHAAPDVAALASALLPVAAAFQVFDGLQAVGSGVLRGMGDTRPAAWFNLLGYYALAQPIGVALAFGLGLGVVGLWCGLTIGLATVALLLVHRIRVHGPRRRSLPDCETTAPVL